MTEGRTTQPPGPFATPIPPTTKGQVGQTMIVRTAPSPVNGSIGYTTSGPRYICPDNLSIDDLGAADTFRGELIRFWFQLLRFWTGV